MLRSPCRNFTIFDGLILVAATAFGLALVRPFMVGWESWTRLHYIIILGQPLLEFWTLALLVIRLRKPRPAIALLFRELGAASSLAASLMIVIWAVSVVCAAYMKPFHVHRDLLEVCGLFVAPSIIGAWITLITSRTASLDPGWIDRFGRLIGVAWLVIFYAILLVPFR